MKTIGVVCEGDRDYEMITETITHFMNEEYHYYWLQPNPEFGTENGNGWKGVWRWCISHSGNLGKYMRGITPAIDLIIVQMDADVARCEPEVYCHNIDISCPGQGHEDLLNCRIAKNNGCKQPLPPNSACDGTIQSRVVYLKSIIGGELCIQDGDPVVITIPCDSTDSWVVAAFEDDSIEPETMDSPWDNLIAKKKDYHGIRVPGRRKGKKPYAAMIEKVCDNWERVKQRCTQAYDFEESVRVYFNKS